MIRFFQSRKQSKQTKSELGPARDTTATGDASRAKSARLPSLKKKQVPPRPPLFSADPEENIRLWMQRYFGEVRVSREDAIRHWLSRPPESRVPSFTDMPAKTDPVTEPAVSVLDSSADMPPASERYVSDVEIDSGREPRFMPTSLNGGEPGHSRSWSRLILRVGLYSLAGVMLVTLLWAIPAKHRAATQASSVATSRGASSADNAAADREQVSDPPANDSSPNETMKTVTSNGDGDVGENPSRIESVSVGCETAQPCIEVNTSGRQIKPQLTTLTLPDRLVMDFAGAEYGAGFHRIAVKRGSVKDVRIHSISDARPASTRVVIDLTAESESVLRTMQNKFVVEITPKTSSN